IVLNRLSMDRAWLKRRVLSSGRASLHSCVQRCLVGFIVQDERWIVRCADRDQKFDQRRQSPLVLRTNEDHTVLGDLLPNMLLVVVPVVRLERVLDERSVERLETSCGLLDQLDEIRREHYDDPKAVVHGSSTERDHRNGLAALNAAVEKARRRASANR